MEDMSRLSVLEKVFLLVLFVSMIGYFCLASPFVIFDSDDWTYIAYSRPPIPLWGNWNPARVLPEVLMPLISRLSVTFIMPFTGDLVMALAYGYGIFISMLIVLYLYLLLTFLKVRFHASHCDATLAGGIFIILHFLLFVSNTQLQQNMFWAINATGLFFYTIPSILNCSALLLLEILFSRKAGSPLKGNYALNGLLLVLIYFSIFSNLLTAYTLPVWGGIHILIALYHAYQKRTFRLAQFIHENTWPIVTILLWAVSAVFEANGGRASSIGDDSMGAAILAVTKSLVKAVLSYNNAAMAFILAVLIVGIVVTVVRKETVLPLLASIGCVFVSLIYLILLCARIGATHGVNYINNAGILFGSLFFVLLLVSILLIRLLKELPQVKIIAPLVVALLFFSIHSNTRLYLHKNQARIDYQTCIAVDRDIIKQVQQANAQGAKTMELYVPRFPVSGDNWPISVYVDIPTSLYKLGLISNPIVPTVVPTEAKNAEFCIPL